ncbi:CLCKB protein, partial [Amia calva]|nr:CLCKB protein [Amia calva]
MCLAALGILTALTSSFMDFTTDRVLNAQRWLIGSVGGGVGLQYLVWIVCPIALTTFGTGFTQSVCPQSAGSGVPEVKTIMGGVPLPDYLTLNNLIAKIVGMTCTLAAGSPVYLGKLGPFVHLSTMLGAFLNRLLSIVCEVGEESFHYEMLVCSAAVAMASCFGCPISGVLFSVEVMSSHFATKNYCRSFFTAICGAMMFRILAICSNERETILPLLSTSFPVDFPFDLPEMVFFAVLGLLCGLLCVVYLFGHRWIIRFTLKNKILKKLLTTEKTLYTGLVVFVLASMTFPGSVGWLMASRLSMRELLTSLLDSQAWVHLPQNSSEPWPPAQVDVKRLWLEWTPPGISVFTTLGVFLSMKFWLLLLACTIPMPAGYFMPVSVSGAAIGRLVGEFVAFVFPEGIQSEGSVNPINPGGYALAAGLLVLEMTGQLYHSLPVLLAVLLSNAVCRRFSPNFYDGIILIKKLPYLPMVLQYHPELCAVKVSQLMKRSVTVLARCGKAGEVRAALTAVLDSEIPVVDTLGEVKHQHNAHRILTQQTTTQGIQSNTM